MERRKELKKLFTTSLGALSSITLLASAGWEGYLGHTTEMGQDLVVAMVVGMNTFFLSEAEEVGEQIITGTVLTDLVQITNIVKSSYYASDDLRTIPSTVGRASALIYSVASQTLFFI
jgi:hypothetical protein